MKKNVFFFILMILYASSYAEILAGAGMNWNLMVKDDYRYIWVDAGAEDKLYEPVVYNLGLNAYRINLRYSVLYFHPLTELLDFVGGTAFSSLSPVLSIGMYIGAGIRIPLTNAVIMRLSGTAQCGSGVYSSWSFFWGGELDLTLEYLFLDSLGVAVNLGLEYRAYPSVRWWDLQYVDIPVSVSLVFPKVRLW